MFDFLFALKDETSAVKTKVRDKLLILKLPVTLLLPFSLQLPLPLPNPFQAFAQVPLPATLPYPVVAVETPKGSMFLFKGGTYNEIALSFARRVGTRSSSTARTNGRRNSSSKRSIPDRTIRR
jgi:hypothetical protein